MVGCGGTDYRDVSRVEVSGRHDPVDGARSVERAGGSPTRTSVVGEGRAGSRRRAKRLLPTPTAIAQGRHPDRDRTQDHSADTHCGDGAAVLGEYERHGHAGEDQNPTCPDQCAYGTARLRIPGPGIRSVGALWRRRSVMRCVCFHAILDEPKGCQGSSVGAGIRSAASQGDVADRVRQHSWLP